MSSTTDHETKPYRAIELTPSNAKSIYKVHTQRPQAPHKQIWEYRYVVVDDGGLLGILWKYDDDHLFSFTLLETDGEEYYAILTRSQYSVIEVAYEAMKSHLRMTFYDTYDPCITD